MDEYDVLPQCVSNRLAVCAGGSIAMSCCFAGYSAWARTHFEAQVTQIHMKTYVTEVACTSQMSYEHHGDTSWASMA